MKREAGLLFALFVGINIFKDWKNTVPLLLAGDTNEMVSGATVTKKTQLPFCTRQQIRQGKWVNRTFEKPFYVPSPGKRCPGRDGIAHDGTFKTHVWEPTSSRNGQCTFLPMDVPLLCQKLTQKTVLVVGDSLATEIFHSFLYFMGKYPARFVANAHLPAHTTRNPVILSVCNDTANIAYLPLDPLFKADELAVHLIHNKTIEPDILILNRGAHIVTDDQYQQELPTLANLLTQYRTRRPDARILWKTTTPGHPNCWEYNAPQANETHMWELIQNASLYTFHKDAKIFRWWWFPSQSQLVLDALMTSSIQLEVLDGWDLLLSRPDLHRGKIMKRYDCLHHCQPGPHDVFAQLLLNYLHMTPQQVMSE